MPFRPPAPMSPQSDTSEWIVARVSAPTYVLDPEPIRPDVVLVMSGGMVLHVDLVRPEEGPEVVGKAVRAALEQPLVGLGLEAPRSVRVNQPQVVDAVRRALDGMAVDVVAGETPEVNPVVESLGELVRQPQPEEEEATYLGPGLVSESTMAGFFRAAARLFHRAPWEFLPEMTISVDSQALGMDGACLTVIGQLGMDLGFLLFDSAADFHTFRQKASQLATSPGVRVFSVTFEDDETLPEAMRAEAIRHGWELPEPGVYPVILSLDHDGVARPASERDVIRAWACCDALEQFLERHGAELSERKGPFVQPYRILHVPGAPDIRLTAPHPGSAQPGMHDIAADEALVDAFISDQIFSLDDNGQDLARIICLQVLQTLEPDAGAPANAESLDELMLRAMPAMVPVPPTMVSLVPGVLARFLRWLGERGPLDSDASEALAQHVLSRTTAFERAMKKDISPDPVQFIAKQLGLALDDATLLSGNFNPFGLSAEGALPVLTSATLEIEETPVAEAPKRKTATRKKAAGKTTRKAAASRASASKTTARKKKATRKTAATRATARKKAAKAPTSKRASPRKTAARKPVARKKKATRKTATRRS